MTETFPNAEENYKVIEKLLAEPENKKCADCTASVCTLFFSLFPFLLYCSSHLTCLFRGPLLLSDSFFTRFTLPLCRCLISCFTRYLFSHSRSLFLLIWEQERSFLPPFYTQFNYVYLPVSRWVYMSRFRYFCLFSLCWNSVCSGDEKCGGREGGREGGDWECKGMERGEGERGESERGGEKEGEDYNASTKGRWKYLFLFLLFI